MWKEEQIYNNRRERERDSNIELRVSCFIVQMFCANRQEDVKKVNVNEMTVYSLRSTVIITTLHLFPGV